MTQTASRGHQSARALTAAGLSVSYGQQEVLSDVTVRVPAGRVTALVGSNGAGKSTLLRTLAGLVRPRGGELTVDGRVLSSANGPRRVSEDKVVMVPEGRQVFGTLTIRENLLVGAWAGGAGAAARKQRLEACVELFPALSGRLDEHAGLLSGGQQQMVAIARGLMAGPDYLLLDEPSLGLAPVVVEAIFERIGAMAETGLGVLVVEQNAAVALSAASYGYLLVGGRVVDEGQDLLSKPELVDKYFGTAGVITGADSAAMHTLLASVLPKLTPAA
jgi:branched-chain amino acid transport system ATP-binding protein